MSIVFSVLIILCCLILILAVLIQNPKGGGLATGFQTGTQVMGVRRTADFLEKATWTLAILLFVFSVAVTGNTKKATQNVVEGQSSSTKDRASDFDQKTKAPNTAAPFGTPKTGTPPPPPAGGGQP